MHSLAQKILRTCERVANNFLHPGANYTYMYNLLTVCKSAHVNGALHHFLNIINSLSSLCVKLKIKFFIASNLRQAIMLTQS